MGIYGNGMGGGDINAVARSQEQQWVAVADDCGLVRLLNYPSVVKAAPGYGHRGHASHIERVGFLAHDYRVITCGGADKATYQWRIRGPGKPPPPPSGVDLGSVLAATKAVGKLKRLVAKRRQSHWQWGATQAEELAAAKIQAVVRGRNVRRSRRPLGDRETETERQRQRDSGGGASDRPGHVRPDGGSKERKQHQARVSLFPQMPRLSIVLCCYAGALE